MPKIGDHWFVYEGNNSLKLKVDVHFGAYGRSRHRLSEKYFWIAFPEAVATFHGINYADGKTAAEVATSFDKSMKEYYDKDQKVKKVIGYKFEKEIGGRDNYDKNIYKEHEMRLQFVVGTMTTIGDKLFFRETKDTRMYAIGEDTWGEYGDFKFVDHTKESEEFFIKTWTALGEMIKKCDKFFDQPADKLLKSIGSSNLLAYDTKRK